MGKRWLPSRQNVQRAMQLGARVARTDLRVQPWLRDAPRFPTYAAFVKAHRQQLEHSAVFARWEAVLSAIVESEAAEHPMENTRQWDRFYTEVTGALHAAFWTAWEQIHRLQDSYIAHVDDAFRQDPESPPQASSPPGFADSPPTEGDLWGRVARKVFDEMEPPAEFWEMPEADSLANKSQG